MTKLNYIRSFISLIKLPYVFLLCFESTAGCDYQVCDLRSTMFSPSYHPGSFSSYQEQSTHCWYTAGYTPASRAPQYIKKADESCHPLTDEQDRSDYPHGHLAITYGPYGIGSGSGVLIGPHHILTAGHNLYDHALQWGWATRVTFTPALSGHQQPCGQAQGAILLVLKNYIDHRERGSDLGMIILDKPLGYQTGWLGLLCAPDPMIEICKIHVTGYPTDKTPTQLTTMTGHPAQVKSDVLKYDMDTRVGQSGGAIWMKHVFQYLGCPGHYVIGIHTHGPNPDFLFHPDAMGQGVRISTDKMTTILQWLETYQLCPQLFSLIIHIDRPMANYADDKQRFLPDSNFLQSLNQLVLLDKTSDGEPQYVHPVKQWFKRFSSLNHFNKPPELKNCLIM